MLEIKGKINTAICYAKVVEDEAIEQIRRMCEYFGYRVEKLERLRIMNIELGDLKPGECRPVTKEELAVLKKSLEKSYSAPRTSASKRRPHSQDKKRVYVAGERHGRTK